MTTARNDRIKIRVNSGGWFKVLLDLIKEKEISADEAARMKAAMFERLSDKMKEATSEIAKLQGVIDRIEAVCRRNTTPKPINGSNVIDGDVELLKQAVKAFHGWTVSMTETDYYLLARVESPHTALQKYVDLPKSLQELQLTRQVTLADPDDKGALFKL